MDMCTIEFLPVYLYVATLVSMLPLSSIDDKSSIEDMFSEGRLGSKDCFKYALNTIDPLFNY
jgi:hypothetical protein